MHGFPHDQFVLHFSEQIKPEGLDEGHFQENPSTSDGHHFSRFNVMHAKWPVSLFIVKRITLRTGIIVKMNYDSSKS